MFIRYLRDEDGRPFGCVVAVVDGGSIETGTPRWGASMCSPRDRFARKRGREIAIGRAEKHGRRDEMLLLLDSPADRAMALRNAVRLIEADIDSRYQWMVDHPVGPHDPSYGGLTPPGI
jgi:hypothetical protein